MSLKVSVTRDKGNKDFFNLNVGGKVKHSYMNKSEAKEAAAATRRRNKKRAKNLKGK